MRLRQSTGRDDQSQDYLLQRFARFLVEQHLTSPRITRALTERYQRARSSLNVRTQYNRLCVVRQFGEYLALDDPQNVVPEPLRHVSSQGAYLPLIDAPEHVCALLEHYLAVERGLAQNTICSYRDALKRLLRYLCEKLHTERRVPKYPSSSARISSCALRMAASM